MDGLTIPSQDLKPGTVQKYYQEPVTMTGSHVFNTPMHWTSLDDNLPPGLDINVTTGAIYGEPTKAGTFELQLHVRDSSGPPQTAVSPWLQIVIS